MDANPASISETGFDAALRALEDLETSVAQTREAIAPAAEPVLVAAPIGGIGLSAIEIDDADVLAALPNTNFTEIDTPAHEPTLAPEPTPAHEPTPAALFVPAASPAPVMKAEAEPVASAAAQTSAVAPSGSGRFGKIVVGLALFSSMVSAAGLIVAERTIMSAQLVVADARERQHQLEQANKLIRDLEIIREKQIELLRQQQIQAASTPVTSAELQHRMDTLQAGLIQRDPINRVVEAIRDGQSDTVARFNEFGLKMARVEAALDRH